MDKARADVLINALAKKGVNRPCSRCGHQYFNVVAETLIPLVPADSHPSLIVPGSPVVPTVVVTCNNCGFITQHALGALGVALAEEAHVG